MQQTAKTKCQAIKIKSHKFVAHYSYCCTIFMDEHVLHTQLHSKYYEYNQT